MTGFESNLCCYDIDQMALNQGNLTKKDSEFIKKRFIAFFLDCFFVFSLALFLIPCGFITTVGVYTVGIPNAFFATQLAKFEFIQQYSNFFLNGSLITTIIYYHLMNASCSNSTSLGMKLVNLRSSFKAKQTILQRIITNWIILYPNFFNIHKIFANITINRLSLKQFKIQNNLHQRAIAIIIDIIMLTIFNISLLVLGFEFDYPYRNILPILQISTIILYYPLFETFFQATPGKALFDLTVLREDQSKMNFWEANLRQLSKLTIPFTLGWAFIKTFWSKDKITLYDKLSKTRVFKCEYEEID